MSSSHEPAIEYSLILERASEGGMSCTLTTRGLGDGSEGVLSKRKFDQSRITIGRGPANDVVLKDATRRVSTKHAEIRAGVSSWVLLDVGSTNGTVLNGTELTAKQEYALQDGDRITFGPFQVVFEEDQPVQTPDSDRQPKCQVPVASGGARSSDPRKVLYLLRRAIADVEASSGKGLEDRLEDILRRAVQGLDHTSATGVVQSVKAALSRTAEYSGTPPKPSMPPPQPVPPPRVAKAAIPSDSFRDFVGSIFEGLNQRGMEDDPDHLVRQITHILQAVFGGLADAVRGRREFQKEFEVDATRILAWTPNPIKHAESAAEIGSLVLNPDAHGLTDDQVVGHLREVFQDLSLHQLGLMAGFRECMRGLLKELDPATLSKPGKGDKGAKGIGLLAGGTLRAEAAAWHRFLQKHRQLTEEEVRVFEQILAPYFAKGYLSVQKARKRP